MVFVYDASEIIKAPTSHVMNLSTTGMLVNRLAFRKLRSEPIRNILGTKGIVGGRVWLAPFVGSIPCLWPAPILEVRLVQGSAGRIPRLLDASEALGERIFVTLVLHDECIQNSRPESGEMFFPRSFSEMMQATIQRVVNYTIGKASTWFNALTGLSPFITLISWLTFLFLSIRSLFARVRCLVFGRCDVDAVELSVLESRLVLPLLRMCRIPSHVGFIMDGNRRYARTRNAETVTGHKMGYDRLRRVLLWCFELGMKEVSVYAFSMDNFSRTHEEVEYLMDLAETKLESLCEDDGFVMKQQIRVKICGEFSLLRPSLQAVVRSVEAKTAHHNKGVFNVMLAYSSKRELNQAIERSLQDTRELTWERIESNLYNSAPLDLVVRTSGETRLSDFLVWQLQAERTVIVFERHLWPEFSIADFARSLVKYHYRVEKLASSSTLVRGG